MDPISARDRRDVRPHRPRFRGGACESFFQICRHRGFRFFCRRRDLERDNVARVCARTLAKLPVNLEPVAFLAVGLERGLKREAIDGAFNCRDPPRRKLRTSILWQYEKGPRFGLSSLRRAEECRFETDLGSGFGHLLCITNRKQQIARAIPQAGKLYVTPQQCKSECVGDFIPRQQRDRWGLALRLEASRPCR